MPARRRLAAVATAAALLPLGLVVPALPAAAAPAGNEVVYTVDADHDGVFALVARDLGTGAVRELLPADPSKGYLYEDPEISPDGTRVLLSTNYRGAGQPPLEDADHVATLALGVLKLDDLSFVPVTTPPQTADTSSEDLFGSWSPNEGSRIVFTRVTYPAGAGAGSSQIFTVAADGTSEPAAVPNTVGGYTADFNPQDGSQIVYAATTNIDDAVGTLTVVGTDGTGQRSLGTVGALPAWSPDGSTIAFVSVPAADEATSRLATVPAAGGTATVLTTTRLAGKRSVAEYPAWSPDGASILYAIYPIDSNDIPQSGDIWAVNPSGNWPDRLIATGGDEGFISVAPQADVTAARLTARCKVALGGAKTVVSRTEATFTARFVRPGASVSVEAYSQPSTAYVVQKTATANSSGVASFTLKPPTNSRFRVKVAGCTVPSGSRAIAVSPKLTFSSTRTGTRAYRFTGHISPAGQNVGRTVTLYSRPAGGSYSKRGSVTVNGNGDYALSYRFSGTGTLYFQWRTAANGVLTVAGSSPTASRRIY